MRTIIPCLLLVLILGGAGFTIMPETDAVGAPKIRFGMDAASIAQQTAAGVRPDLATLWVGPWTLQSGWSGIDRSLVAMRQAGVTPAVHLYYWGGDISRDCLQNGCWSHVHQVWKDRAGWDRLTEQLIAHLDANMGGKRVVVFLESEFNNGDVQTFETLDRQLKGKADRLHVGYGNTEVVLSLGNWNRGHWSTWDRAAAASDAIGIQGLRGSTRDSWDSYHHLYEDTLAGVKKAKSLFGKAIFIQDVGLSTYPEPAYRQAQASALEEFFAGLPTLRSLGVQAILYRAWNDDPQGNLREYYGVAERHWGLAYAWGGQKDAAKVWIDGVKGERAGEAVTGAASTAAFTFAPRSIGNPWWVEVKVGGASSVSAQVDSGSWIPLAKTSWGTWARSFHVPMGSQVSFRAADGAGSRATSSAYDWETGSTGSGFKATFSPRSVGNPWWVDVRVEASQPLEAVSARVDDGPWIPLAKTSWGTWAKSFHVPHGAPVSFRAIDIDGDRERSEASRWGETFDAAFHARSVGNDWWVETAVTSGSPVHRVDARIGDGPWIRLTGTSWGTWATSVHVPDESRIVFRAGDASGDTDTSRPVPW